MELRLILGGVAVFGLVWVVIGTGMIYSQARFRRRSLTTQGIVTGSRVVSSRDTKTTGVMYRPTVRFTTADGQEIESETRTASNLAPHRSGKAVTVYYDPADPLRFSIGAIARVTGCVASACIAMGGFVFLIAAVILIDVGL